MYEVNELARTLGSVPFWALVAIVLLAGFALSAFAIYAVMTVAKGRK